MPELNDLLTQFQNEKELFRNKICDASPTREKLIEILKNKKKGIAKYSESYNSSIRGNNSRIVTQFKTAISQLDHWNDCEQGVVLQNLRLSYKLILSKQIVNLLTPELKILYDNLLKYKSKILELSNTTILRAAKNKKYYSFILDKDDLLQEAYIIADESLWLYNHNFSSENTWFAYLITRINKILSKKLVEIQPTLQVSRSVKDSIHHYTLSDPKVTNQLNMLDTDLIETDIFLGKLLSSLTEKEYEYIILRYGLEGNTPHNIKTISKILNKSTVYLHSLEKEILEKLRSK